MKVIFYVIGYEKKGKRGIIVKKKLADAEKTYDKQIKTPGIIRACLIEFYSQTNCKVLKEYEQKQIDL